MRAKRFIRLCGCAALAGFGLLQFTNPPRSNPAVSPGSDLCATDAPPAQVAAVLRQACYDCHSDETKWPWYSRIAPISWTVASDVQDGRQQLNFSQWPREDTARVQKRLKKIARDVEEGEMPPAKYTWLHRDARLSPEERQAIIKWAKEQMGKKGGEP